MIDNVKNQQQDQKQIAEKGWIVQFAPVFATLVPASEHRADIISSHENYVDITKFKNLELELQKTKEKLQTTELIKIDLIKNIGHSINVPCNGIFAQVAVLYEIEHNPEVKNHLATIMDGAKALLDYSNDLYEFLQRNSGLTSIVLQAFSPKKLVEAIIAKAGAAALNKGIRLVSNIHYEMPDVLVGDSYRLQAILDQLVGNSIKFTEEGVVVITANLFSARSLRQDENDFDVLEQEDRDRLLQFIVHDTGIGISEEKQQYICEEIGSISSSTQCKGLGLGLMFVKQLIHEMHGAIELSSEEGKTTTVECKIPVKLPNSTDSE
ncbi:sensor histidine kinase [Candidatus Tisiphia endosymbiont of Nemotelus uliginosus]|uniref:sensor histidine kinase n=1 Tax=Candidatus Tisiphia endosymbiont of Nemotelus uliginosus TaxID=3077926 RepID=UPI0035C8F661